MTRRAQPDRFGQAGAFSSEVDTGSREENASKQEIQSPVPISIGTRLLLMMNGESVVAAAPAAMTSPANQLEFRQIRHAMARPCRREIGSYL
jgi:hypothetical protein